MYLIKFLHSFGTALYLSNNWVTLNEPEADRFTSISAAKTAALNSDFSDQQFIILPIK